MTEVFDCNDLRDALLSGASLDDPQVRAHVQGCAGCAELLAEDAALGHALAAAPAAAPEIDLSGMLAGLDGALAQEQSKLAWLRNRPTTVRIAAVVGLGLVIALIGGAAKMRPDLPVYPVARLALTVLGYVALMAVAAVVALRPMYRPALPRGVAAGLLALAVVVPFLIAGMPQAHADFTASLAGTGDELIPRAFACFRYGVMLSLPVFAVAAFADRNALRAGLLPVLLGAAAGLIGVVSLELHCPITEPAHLLLGHATVAACLALIALGIGALRRRKSV